MDALAVTPVDSWIHLVWLQLALKWVKILSSFGGFY
jgi:hypothetical protein